MQLRSVVCAAMLVTPGLAAAQMPLPSMQPAPPLSGLYIGAGVGVNWLQNEHLINTQGTAVNGSISSHVGMVGVASIGYALPNGLRFELEGDLRNNPINAAHDLGFPAIAGGRERKFGPMFNVLYDFSNLLPVPYFSPYLGVGVGYQWARMSGLHVNGAPTGFPAFSSGDTTGAIAYQFILGGAMPIPSVRGLALTAEYRFLGVGSRTYNVSAITAPGEPVLPGRVKFGNDFNHALLIGLRYNFGVAPPPPPAPAPVPAQAPARSYLVFFDWDKATLTDRARQIIREAADNSTKVQYTRIEVNGYTDTSGTPRYNQGLSVRRARAVQAELVKDGVPANAITIQGFGDTHLLVPTGPGVREPQNRRVEIIIR
jgi:outer membrane protein OmpA-like peptidoglycan-associated protein